MEIKDLPSCGGTTITPVIHRIKNSIKDEKGYVHVILTDGWVENTFPTLHPKIRKHVLVGLTDTKADLIKQMKPAFVFVFRKKDDKHI